MVNNKKKDVPRQEVVKLDREIFRGNVPRGLYEEALESGAVFGYNKSDILIAALTMWVTSSGVQEARQKFLEREAEKHGITIEEVKARIFDSYKEIGRSKRANLEGESNEE